MNEVHSYQLDVIAFFESLDEKNESLMDCSGKRLTIGASVTSRESANLVVQIHKLTESASFVNEFHY